MTDLRAAAEMALERLTMWLEDFPDTAVIEDRWAVEALRQALAQPEQDHGFDRTASHMAGEYVDTAPPSKSEQEPVVRFNWNEAKFEWLTEYSYEKHHMKPLYLAPPSKPWVSLTDEQIIACGWCDLKFARAIEAASRSKNE